MFNENCKLPIEEQIILSLLEKKYKYITRDFNGELFLWETKPRKDKTNKEWISDGNCQNFNLYMKVFLSIQYEDAEPFKISSIFES